MVPGPARRRKHDLERRTTSVERERFRVGRAAQSGPEYSGGRQELDGAGGECLTPDRVA